MQRNKTLALRLTEAEYNHLKLLSISEHLSVSEYIRRRLFEDPVFSHEAYDDEEHHKSDVEHDKNMMKFVLTSFVLSKNLAKLQLPEQVYKDAMEQARQILKDWGYE